MSEPTEKPPRRRYIRTVVGVLLLVGAVTVIASGAFEDLSGPRLRELVRESGAWGPVLYVAAFGALQPFGFSAHVLVPTAALIWEPQVALVLAWLGAMASTTTSFWFARHLGQGWVQARLPERLRGYDERLTTRGFRTVLALRLLFYTFAPVQLMFGVSRVRYRDVMAGSAIGLIPMLAVEVLLGMGLLAWLTG